MPERQPYAREDAERWLAWLARGMRRHGQSEFWIEKLQPSWLTSSLQRLAYVLMFSLILGLACALIMGAFYKVAARLYPDAGEAVDQGLLIWLFIQYPIWLLTIAYLERRSAGSLAPVTRGWRAFGRATTHILAFWLLWLVWPAVEWIRGIWDLQNLPLRVQGFVMTGLVSSMFAGIVGSRRSVTFDIQPVESLGLSWRKALEGALWGLPAGFCLWLLVFGFGRLDYLLSHLVHAAEVGAILGGLRPRIVETKVRPNQGIRLSVRNAFLPSAALSLVYGATVLGFTVWMEEGISFADAVLFALGCAVTIFYCLSSWFGGMDVLKHYLVRLILASTRQLPGGCVRFLDYATELGFLQKVGGGYMFIHRYLLEHFAEMEVAESADESSVV